MNRRDFMAALGAGTFFALMPGQRSYAASKADLAHLDLMDTAAAIAAGDVSMMEVTYAAMDRIDALDPQLNAVVTKSYDYGLRQLAKGRQGPLAGVPYLLKDLNPLAGVRLTNGSRLFSSYTAQKNFPFTDKVLETGVVILGKTNTPEFGLMPTTEPIANGPSRNPWNTEYSTGGSSGGAAAAVAARMVPAAGASDGGGSIRFPSSACHLFGIKPSRGRFGGQNNPRRLVDLSVKHTISRTVRDSAYLLALTENGEGATLPPIGFIEGPSNQKRKIALSYNVREITPDADTKRVVGRVAKALEKLGHEVELVNKTPHDDPVFQDLFTKIWASGARDLLAVAEKMIGMPATKSKLLEPNTLKMIEMFAPITSDDSQFVKDTIIRLQGEMNDFMANYDAWLTPMSPMATPKLGYFIADLPAEELMDRSAHYASYTPIHNALGTTAMSVPGGFSSNNIPMGVQIAANIGQEAVLLDLAYQLEATIPWGDQMPPIVAG